MFNFYNNNFKNQNNTKEVDKTNEQKNSLNCESLTNEENKVNVNLKVNASAINFEELQKARQDLVGEILAIIDYDKHINNATNNLAKATWVDIKNEELVHVGELLALIDYLDSSQKKFIEKGFNEFLSRLKNGQ